MLKGHCQKVYGVICLDSAVFCWVKWTLFSKSWILKFLKAWLVKAALQPHITVDFGLIFILEDNDMYVSCEKHKDNNINTVKGAFLKNIL